MTPTLLPETMALEGSLIPLEDYLAKKAEDFSQRHPERKEGVSVDAIREMLWVCIEGREFPVETERWWDILNEEICQDLWNTEQFNNQKETMPETTLEPVATKPLNLQLVEIVEAARTTTMAHGFADMVQTMEFGESFSDIRMKDGTTVSPKSLAACVGLGMDLGQKGQSLVAAAVSQLLAKGDSMVDVVEQIGAVLKLKYSTLSNYNRTYLRTPTRYKSLPFEVQKEIATSSYTGDDKQDRKIREQLFEQALAEGWNPSEARSHRKAAQGHNEEITANAPGEKEKPYAARYFYGVGSKGSYSKVLPVFESGMWCVDIHDKTFLVDDGKKWSFQPMEKAE